MSKPRKPKSRASWAAMKRAGRKFDTKGRGDKGRPPSPDKWTPDDSTDERERRPKP